MAFDANKEIKIEASQADDGSFTLRSRGLAKHRRAELEISGVPEKALHAAGRVVNDVANYTVNRAEVLANQNVGLVLRAGDDDERPLMLVVRTVAAEAAKTGLWASLTGGGKGVLRLVDPTGETSRPPLIALTTMLIHRSAVRLAGDDEAGAREELRAAIEIFPGDEDSKDAPTIGDGEAAFNWQNHLAYLALARIEEDDGEAADLFGKGLARSKEHALRELGATVDALAKVDPATLEREAARIVEHNLGGSALRDGPVPSEYHAFLVSPLWEPFEGGSARSATLIPARFVELYYEGAAAEGLRRDGAGLAATAVAEALSSPATLAWRTRAARATWRDPSAPIVEKVAGANAAHGLLSLVLAYSARCFRAGATADEIRGWLRGDDVTLAAKLAELESWETEQYSAAITMGR